MKVINSDFINDPQNKNSIDQYLLFTLLCSSLLSLALLMSGTCDN